MLTSILVPIFVCVVLPVAIVWIVFYSTRNRNNNQTQIILEALRSNPDLDANKLIRNLRDPRKTPMQYLNKRLLIGSIFTLIGITFALLSIFSPDEDFILVSWFFCGIFGSIGIGYLISYGFAYKNLDRMEKEYSSISGNE